MRAVADLRCGSRLDGFPFLQPRPTSVWPGLFSVRRDAGFSSKGSVNSAPSGHAQEIPAWRTPAGVSLSSQVCVAPLALRGLQSRVSDSAMIDKPGCRFAPPWSVEETHA
jgi:hypothetical protein